MAPSFKRVILKEMLSQEDTVSILNKALKQSARLRKGTDAVYFCPKCKHHKRKLEINIVSGKYHCWVCNLSGLNLRSLFNKLNVSKEYYKILDQSSGIRLNPGRKIEDLKDVFLQKPKTLDVSKLPDEYRPLNEYKNSIEYRNAISYLLKRNITKHDILRYQIGYCEDGIYRQRIIIPSYNKDNDLNFFVGRSYYEHSKLKYNNCTFNKNIIGFESVVDFNQQITLVEGPFDAMAVRYNVIPLFGKNLSKKLKIELLVNKVPSVNVLLDNDAFNDSVRIVEFLIKNNIPTRIINIGEKDPSVLGFERTWELIRSSKILDFKSFFELKMNYEHRKN